MYEQYDTVNQTQLGEMFGTTSHKIGKWLIDAGLRTKNKKPSYTAFNEGYVTTSHNGRGNGWYYVWRREPTVAALEALGHQRVDTKVPDDASV